jgi:hypothetical protein
MFGDIRTHRPPRRERKRDHPLIPLFQHRPLVPPETPLPRRTRPQKDLFRRPHLVRPLDHQPLDLFLQRLFPISTEHRTSRVGFGLGIVVQGLRPSLLFTCYPERNHRASETESRVSLTPTTCFRLGPCLETHWYTDEKSYASKP